jgi:hypothetical protein
VAEDKLFPFQDKMVKGESIEVEANSEPFSQYTLADGSTVKVKLVLLDAIRLDAFNDQGDPVYQFQFQQIIGVMVPQHLKRKVQ